MSLRISYSDYIVFEAPPIERIKKLIDFGAHGIEINMNGFRYDKECMDFHDIKSILKNKNIAVTVHPPIEGINLAAPNEEVRRRSIEVHKTAIEFAYNLEASYIVVHPGYYEKNNSKEEMIMRSKDSIQEVNQYAKSFNMMLAVENVGDSQTSLFSQDTYVEFLKGMDKENIFYLIDTGHGHITKWDLKTLINTTKERLIGLHIHDNLGENDSHLAVGEGSIQWKEVFTAVKSIDRDVNIVLEYSPKVSIDKLKLINKHI